MQNPGTDSVGPYLQSLSLTILVNLCSKNIIVVNLLFKTVNIKDLVKRLMGLRVRYFSLFNDVIDLLSN